MVSYKCLLGSLVIFYSSQASSAPAPLEVRATAANPTCFSLSVPSRGFVHDLGGPLGFSSTATSLYSINASGGLTEAKSGGAIMVYNAATIAPPAGSPPGHYPGNLLALLASSADYPAVKTKWGTNTIQLLDKNGNPVSLMVCTSSGTQFLSLAQYTLPSQNCLSAGSTFNVAAATGC